MKNLLNKVPIFLILVCLGCQSSISQAPHGNQVSQTDQNNGPLSPSNIKERGGGEAVLCYISQETYSEVRKGLEKETTIDLHLDELSMSPRMRESYEAGEGYRDQDTTLDQMLHMMGMISPKFWTAFQNAPNTPTIWKGIHERVQKISDSGSPIPESYGVNRCVTVPIAYYDDSQNVVYYDQDIFDLMTPYERVILRLHEVLYHFEREQIYAYNRIVFNYLRIIPQRDELAPGEKYALMAYIRCWLVWQMDSNYVREIIKYVTEIRLPREYYGSDIGGLVYDSELFYSRLKQAKNIIRVEGCKLSDVMPSPHSVPLGLEGEWSP